MHCVVAVVQVATAQALVERCSLAARSHPKRQHFAQESEAATWAVARATPRVVVVLVPVVALAEATSQLQELR